MTRNTQEMTPPTNLAIAYAPLRVRSAFALLLQIDNRLANILRSSREPMIGQIKMAWWREAFGQAPHQRPKGEPLLQALTEIDDLIPHTALEALVLGWEILLGSERWNQEDIDRHADLRTEAIFQTFAHWIGSERDIRPIGRLWALETLRMAFPERVADNITLPPAPLPKVRALRPLSILALSMRTDSGLRLVWHALTGH